jgi:hypothetical protein
LPQYDKITSIVKDCYNMIQQNKTRPWWIQSPLKSGFYVQTGIIKFSAHHKRLFSNSCFLSYFYFTEFKAWTKTIVYDVLKI